MVQACFFGDSERPLYGVYHAPPIEHLSDRGVLLCYPVGYEYMGSHWAFRRLAKLLTEAGLHVFRFDYFGTGDSAGESGEGSVAQWKADICLAFDELRDMSGAREVSLIGYRLGAALGAEASTEGLHIKDLVLWDPVVNGKKYIDELKALHNSLSPLFGSTLLNDEFDELLGYAFPAELRVGIEGINLLEISGWKAEKISIVASSERMDYADLRDYIAGSCGNSDYRLVKEADDRDKPESVGEAMLGNESLKAIRAVLTGNQE
jgi:pimeloyl-ACP methyl ester carboxylesterase